ncbi:MAG: glycogen phosphorylase [Proteobacteria bacterium]|nr:MAG: glycogen phosphorylase [Pseudomonadota bacterium]
MSATYEVAQRTAWDGDAIAASMRRVIHSWMGKHWNEASPRDFFAALSLAARERVVQRWFATQERIRAAGAKRVYYLSIEFLIGRSLASSLLNLGVLDDVERALRSFGVDWEAVLEAEPDAALGNGGLGRLAACFLESLASLDMPGFGYGINYDYGLFRQAIENGQQREYPEGWRRPGAAWLIERHDRACLVPVYGRAGRRPRDGEPADWHDFRVIVGLPYDLPVVGYGGTTVNHLRLYSARSTDEFDIDIFNRGDYLRAFERKLAIERISNVLYPSDTNEQGRELRLLQEYFFVACALHDIFATFRESHADWELLPDKVAIHLNDTHPALAVAEFVRRLVDEHGVGFDRAHALARRTFAYTNHTLMPEALEQWPRAMLGRVVPRHLQIIEEINARLLAEVELRWPGDIERIRRMSIIDEDPAKHVRMAHLAIAGSHAVNGVSQLHSDLVKKTLVPDFAELWPANFQNVTNGVTPRRWLLRANPLLADAITRRIGDAWVRDLGQLQALEPAADDAGFREEFRAVKRANKERLARVVAQAAGVRVDPAALFDVQVKRIHEYKRQLLAALHLIHLYLQIAEDGRTLDAPRVCLFAGKAAPEYFLAKLVIRLIANVAAVVNADPRAEGQLQVAFIPDYRVSLAEQIIPAADLSEQISTAGTEASGTGNMKLALNGALTIGTLDGANIEICEAVGADNLYLFGLRTHEIADLRARQAYDPRERYERCEPLRRVLDAVGSERFAAGEPGLFGPILQTLLDHGDRYFVLADFESYAATQERVARDFRDADAWSRRAALTVARMGGFSSDRAVREYAERIWRLQPLP